MLRKLPTQSYFLRRAAWTCRRGPGLSVSQPGIHVECSNDAVHHEWRVRLFDSAHARSYAVDLGHFPDRWFLGPSGAVSFSRSDNEAGRPNSFRILTKQLKGLRSSGTDLGLGTDLAIDKHLLFQIDEKDFNLITKADGAALSIQLTSTPPDRQLSEATTLLQEDMSCLTSQTLRLPVSYTFHHPADYHEQGTALAYVQHTWGHAIASHWLTCLGYNFTPNGSIELLKACKQAPAQPINAMQTILDMSVAEGQFAIGYHTPLLHWFLDSFAPKTSLTSDVEAEYGKFTITAEQGSRKLVISASAPHRTFDILSLPTQQGFQEKGIQTHSGTTSVEAFEHGMLLDSKVVMGVNLQFGAAYAERTVQRMTAQQYSSPLRYKGKGITR